MGDTIQRKSCLTIDREYKSGMSKVFIEVSFFLFDSEVSRSIKHKRKVWSRDFDTSGTCRMSQDLELFY